MSTATRVISGSAAAWLRIGAGLLTQVALVPIYLSYWDVKTFGVWVAVQAFVNMFVILDRGFTDYLGFEFLKTGAANKSQIAALLWPGLRMLVLLALTEFFIVLFLSFSLPAFLIGDVFVGNASLVTSAGWALFLQWLGWTVLNTAGLFFRAFAPFGYYPRMQWWALVASLLTALVSALVIVYGGSIVTTAAAICIGQMILTAVQYADIHYLLKKTGLSKLRVSIGVSFKHFGISLMLSLKYFLENFRQPGLRILLAPLVGISGLASFTTMRTASNGLLQGLSTITNPVLPELMRFLNERNQLKSEGALGMVWLLLVAVLAPAAVVFQWFAGRLFTLWTMGSVTFDPWLFGFLSVGVLVYALSQPALAILAGNNLLKLQIGLSAVSFATLTGGLLALVPVFGMKGAGLALMISEAIVAAGLVYYAARWLQRNQLRWPTRSSGIAGLSVCIAFAGIMALNVFEVYRWVVLLLTLLLLIANAVRYGYAMPPVVWEQTHIQMKKFRTLFKRTEE